jgi:hypothetical protein
MMGLKDEPELVTSQCSERLVIEIFNGMALDGDATLRRSIEKPD